MVSISGVILFLLVWNLNIHFIFSTENIVRGRRFLCASYDPDLVKLNCTFKRVNRTTEFWSFELDYLVPFKNMHINLTNFSQQQNLEYKPQMIINFHVDCCKWVDGSMANKIMDILFRDLMRYGNSITPCPHYGHLYLRNMTFNDKYFPPIVPSGDIYLNFEYYSYINGKIRKLFYLRPYLEIRYKGINHW